VSGINGCYALPPPREHQGHPMYRRNKRKGWEHQTNGYQNKLSVGDKPKDGTVHLEQTISVIG